MQPIIKAQNKLSKGEHFAQVNGLTMHYYVEGSGPVCLIPSPGWGISVDYMRTITALKKHFTVVWCDDTRNTGKSNGPDVINDLIEINNDRTAGFEKTIADIKDENIDLSGLFQGYAEQSRKNGQQLAALVGNVDEVETGNSVSGKLHRAWIDVKSLFGGNDRAGILSEAERGEDAIKKAYKDALAGGDLPVNALEIINSQALEINEAHDEIKALRNAAKQ